MFANAAYTIAYLTFTNIYKPSLQVFPLKNVPEHLQEKVESICRQVPPLRQGYAAHVFSHCPFTSEITRVKITCGE